VSQQSSGSSSATLSGVDAAGVYQLQPPAEIIERNGTGSGDEFHNRTDSFDSQRTVSGSSSVDGFNWLVV